MLRHCASRASRGARAWLPLLAPAAAAVAAVTASGADADTAASDAAVGERPVDFDKDHYGAHGLNGRFLQDDALEVFAGTNTCCSAGFGGKFEDPQHREIARPEVHAAIMREFQKHGIGAEHGGSGERGERGAGTRLIDVGAGTGLFLESFARLVGTDGHVRAIDITPPFVEFMRERVRTAVDPELQNRISVSLCTPTSTCLGDAGAADNDRLDRSGSGAGVGEGYDAAFICDVYHHFEYPKTFMASLRDAMRPGGIVLLIDFYRDPDKMVTHDPQWALSHLRAGRHEFLMEILETGGFELVAMPDLEGLLAENYCLVFKRREERPRGGEAGVVA